MRFKDYIFKHLKNQKQNLQDAVIDIPRQTYAVGVFSNPEDKDPKIKPEIIGMIMKQFTEFKKEYPILDYSLIGSILTKRYRDDADLDINILFDVPESEREAALEALRKNLKDVNGTQKVFNHRAKMNGLSSSGKWSEDQEAKSVA